MDDIEKITARLRARALRVDRACTQESGSDCWLLWDLEAWNKVLAIVGLELIEAQPGRLALQALPTTRRQYFDKNEFYAAAFVFSWLPEAHRCIQAIKLEGSATELFYRPTFALALALGRSCNIRDLALRGGNHTFMCEEELVEGLRSLRALQSLDLSNFPVNETIGKHLVALLRRNSDHLTSAAIEGTDMSFNTTNQILSALNSCRHLNQLSLANNELNHKCIKTLSSLLRTSKSLRKLTLGGCFRAYVDLRVLSDALEVNASLNELSLRRCEADLTLVLKALSTNKILKRLDLSHSRLNNTQVATLSTALQRNTALQHLLLKHCGINDAAAEALAAALKTNCTLEMLNLKCNIVSIAGVAEFCEALRNNTTIKMIQFCGVAGSQNERTNLSLQMAKDKGYSRIQMTWSDPDIAPLLAAVALTSESPTELHVRCINDFSEGSVCALLENLAKNTKVEVLIIEVAQHRRQAVNVLCTTLALNQGIRRLRVTTAPREASDCGCFSLVAKALIFNHTVAEVTMESETTCLRSVKTIAYLLSRNTSITKLAVNCNNWITVKRFAILSRAVNKNKSILEFSLPKGIEANCVSHRILRALRRNISLHNLAITFVTRERLDRRAAQAVEELCTSASFVTEVMNAKGQGAKEARCTTLSTYRYIQSNYFRLTGVVCGTVVCYPSASTQLDDLNYDCWCNIVKHLKLSDVVQTQP